MSDKMTEQAKCRDWNLDPLREQLAKALYVNECAEEHTRTPKDWANWPTDSIRQPWCQSYYRDADRLLTQFTIAAAAPARPEAETITRECVNCHTPITACMGLVKAGDLLSAIAGTRPYTVDGKSNIRELCGRCGLIWDWSPVDGETLVRRCEAALFVLGDWSLHSGMKANWKIDCDSLSDSDIETLAVMLTERLPAFGSVEGVPRGGLRLAAALQKFVSTGPLLIVDDVLTTGGSMEVHRAGRKAIGAIIFARGIPASWITPLFQLRSTEAAGLEERLAQMTKWRDEFSQATIDGRNKIEGLERHNAQLQQEVQNVTINAVRILAGGCDKHREMTFDSFIAAGGNKCALCLAEQLAQREQELSMLRRERKGEVWCWQDDEEDHPESLSCPVLVQPDVIRRFVAAEAAGDRAREALRVIAVALKEPAGGEYWSARKLADKWGIYHDDLDGERVLVKLAEFALATTMPQEEK